MIKELIKKFQNWFKTKSEANSLEGWSFWKWFVGNYKTIKEVIKIGGPYLIGYLVTHNILTASGTALLGKLALDTLEFWFKQKSQ